MKIAVITTLLALSALIATGMAGPHSPAAAPSSDCCSPASPSTVDRHALTLDGANAAIAAALAKARERHASGAIAVVDDGGSLLAFQRLDTTFAAAAPVSIGKARTAALFKKPTKDFEDAINGGRAALAAVNELTPLQGGVPILHDGQVVGAIGVSGAHNQQEDEEIARAGAAAINVDSSASSR